jgi:hypothetical protein
MGREVVGFSKFFAMEENVRNTIKKLSIILVFITTIILLVGCGRFAMGNKDFEYIKQKGVMKITIQSNRDKSYRFTVTDKEAIKDIYNILSSGKEEQEKTTLQPDYIFEIYEGPNKVSKFNYVTGLDKKNGANFYSDTKSYIVSKRLDNDIIKNFENIRKPIDFENIYYDSIYRTLEQFDTGEMQKSKIGINLSGDVEAVKFQLSTDLMYFEDRLKKTKNASLVKDNNVEGYDKIMKVTTEGYTGTKYKATVTFEGKGNEKPAIYYINNIYEQGSWKINITQEKPEGF